MERNFSNELTLSVLDDGNALNVPSDVLNLAGFVSGDVVQFEVVNEKIIISRNDVPQKGTLESLFKNYDGQSFKTSLINLGEAVGEEKW